MELVTEELRQELLNNWNSEDQDLKPVLKIFSPIGAGTWMIASMNPNDNDTMYGLCDPGLGSPELGYVPLSELQQMRIPFMAGVEMELERDLYFEPQHSLAVYDSAAYLNEGITEDPKLLDAASIS